MDIGTASIDGIELLQVKGEIDHFTASEFDEALSDRLGASNSTLVLDLSECSFIDSGGLNVLLLAVMKRRGEGWLGVLGANPRLVRLFDTVGLTQTPSFRLLDDLAGL